MPNINVNFNSTVGTIPRYHEYSNTIERTKGSLDAQNIKELGIKLERVFIVLELCAPSRGVFEFSDQHGWPYGNDPLIDNVISHNAKPLISFHPKLPAWLRSGISTVPNNYDDYQNVIYNVLKHLKQKYNIDYCDFMNEPEMNYIPASECAKMYQRVAIAIQQVNNELPAGTPKILIGGPSFGWSDPYHDALCRDGGNPTSLPYLTTFINYVKNNNLPFDFSNYHYYGNNPDAFATDWNNILSGFGIQKEIQVGELGYYVYNDPCNMGQLPPPCTIKIPNNNEITASAAYTMFAFHKYLNMPLNQSIKPFHFALNDYARHDRSCIVPTRVSGTDGKVYPLYNAMMMWKKLSQGTRISATSDDPAGRGMGVRAVASKSGNSLYLLIYNYGETSNANITLSGYPTGAAPYKRYLTDGTHGNYAYNPSKDKAEIVEDTTVNITNPYLLNIPLARHAVTLITLNEPSGNGCPELINTFKIDKI